MTDTQKTKDEIIKDTLADCVQTLKIQLRINRTLMRRLNDTQRVVNVLVVAGFLLVVYHLVKAVASFF
jgi:hypothetical protein